MYLYLVIYKVYICSTMQIYRLQNQYKAMYEVCNNSFEFFADYVRSDEITVLCHNEADLSGIENILVLVFSCLLQEMRMSQ